MVLARIYIDSHIKLQPMTSNLVKPRGNPANLKRAGMGRPKGVSNMATKALKEMVFLEGWNLAGERGHDTSAGDL